MVRGQKSLNFQDSKFQPKKTFWTKRVNRFRDKKSMTKIILRQKKCVNRFCDTKVCALILFVTKKVCKGHPETFQTIRKLSRPSWKFPDGSETSRCNFRDYAPKISRRAKTSGWQCHDATMVFVPLVMVSLVGLRGQHTNIAASSDSGRIICNRRTVFVSVSLSLGGQTDNLLRFYHNAPPDSNISSLSNVKTSQLCTHRYQMRQQEIKPKRSKYENIEVAIFWHESALQAPIA